MMSNVEIRQVTDFSEIVRLSPLIKKFFQKTKNDYTEHDFYSKIPYILENGVIFYALEDDEPQAYLIAVKVNMISGPALLVFQAYSEKLFIIKKIRDVGDKWALEHGFTKYIALIEPDKENFFSMHYQMHREQILVSRTINVELIKTFPENLNGEKKLEGVESENT